MKLFGCVCGNALFFENSQCVACGREVGWCPVCDKINALLPEGDGWRCGNADCGAALLKCENYAVHNVCNRMVDAGRGPGLCDACRFNETVPDLSVDGNAEKWRRLEEGKRRLFYMLDRLGLPYGTEADGIDPPLSFQFMADINAQSPESWALDDSETIHTGHADGVITINIREADSVEREKARVSFGEAHRTVIGHFRHEIGHYYWQMQVEGHGEADFRALFGDHENPSYGDAMDAYYQNGPPADWPGRFISAYASMHPWEDFAETFSAWLGMASVLDTASSLGIAHDADPRNASFDALINAYRRIGMIANELNRDMGLADLAPHALVPPVLEKMRYVHDLMRSAGERASSNQVQG